jgi:predicted dehydrogenase
VYDIGLIGCGEIGSRHLQALKLSQQDLRIGVVDPSAEARTMAAKRAETVAPNRNVSISFHDRIESLPKQLAVAIIATSSRHRLDILKSLLAHSDVEHVILEKVLFQQIVDYYEAEQILDSSALHGWVNCPRRMMKCFQQLRAYLGTYGPISYRVSGTNWGLGCNAIHFIDNLSMYIGADRYELSTAGLDPVLHESKRTGFVEFTGELSGRFEQAEHSFLLKCDHGESVAYATDIENDRFRISFSSLSSIASVEDKQDAKTDQIEFQMAYQSQLTHLAVQQLINTGRCDLPGYRESMNLHLPLIEGLQTFVEAITGARQDRVEIT